MTNDSGDFTQKSKKPYHTCKPRCKNFLEYYLNNTLEKYVLAQFNVSAILCNGFIKNQTEVNLTFQKQEERKSPNGEIFHHNVIM